MRALAGATVVALMLAVPSPAAPQDFRSSVQAFGGLGLGSVSTIDPTYGGLITAHVSDNVQVVGEAGRIGNVLPTTTRSLIGLSPVGFGVSAWYAEGGVRFTGGRSAVRPYVAALAGIARLQPRVRGLGSGVPSVLSDIGLRLLDRTTPIASIGGGVSLEGGPLVLDVGYRHRRILSDSWVDALALGGNLGANEVRVGIGVRF